jgi:hypothetical protein
LIGQNDREFNRRSRRCGVSGTQARGANLSQRRETSAFAVLLLRDREMIGVTQAGGELVPQLAAFASSAKRDETAN